MKTLDRIYEETKALPETVQREVLDFVEYMAHKLQKKMLTGLGYPWLRRCVV